MKRITLTALIIISLMFVACTPIDMATFNPFEYNAFSEVEVSPGNRLNDELANIDPETATVEQVQAMIDSMYDNAFITNLESDPVAKTKVIATFDKVLSTPPVVSSTPTAEQKVVLKTYQDTAIAKATIVTATTGGDEFVTNLGGLLDTMMGGGDTTDDPDNPEPESSPEDIITSLIPASMKTVTTEYNTETGTFDEVLVLDPAAKDDFVAMVDGLLAANEAFNLLGASLQTDPVTGEPVFENEETVAADVAQTALVASVVSSFSTAVSVNIPVDSVSGEPVVSSSEVIFALIADDPENDNDGIVMSTDPVTGAETLTMTNALGEEVSIPLDLSGFDPFGDLDPESGSGTSSIVAASGLDVLLAGFFGGDNDDPAVVE